MDESLRCHEVLDSFYHETLLPSDRPILSQGGNEILDRNLNAVYGLPDLYNVDLGTPPDFQLAVSLSRGSLLVPICLPILILPRFFCVVTGFAVWITGEHWQLAG